MKKLTFLLCLFSFFINLKIYSTDRTSLFDSGWKFHRGGAQGAEMKEFDDSSWRIVDLPHDWSIEDLPGTNSPFNRDAVSQVSGGFTTGGTGWYRKTFAVPEQQRDRRIIIEFEGVYMNSEVWINGISLGSHPYGYTSFWYDLTDKIKFGGSNILAVQVRNEGENSRWYSGSGIYRHVWLKVLEPVHISQWGTSITTPEVTTSSAKVNIRTGVTNRSASALKIRIITRILNFRGVETNKSESEQSIEKDGTSFFSQTVVIGNPNLWSTEDPIMYTAVSEIYTGNKMTDRAETKFGIRTIHFDPVNGFQLNGKTMKLKGGCFHDDHGPLGSKSYDRAEERRVELLKENGFNAVRCSHNPPAPAFLDACDRLGLLVIDEAFDMWQSPKNPYDYSLYFEKWWQKDIESMVLRDRNHPSIILWSIGNEIPGMDSPEVVKTSKMIADYIRNSDRTRPVIGAVNGINPTKDQFFSTLDVGGYNYGTGGGGIRDSIFSFDHKRVPGRIMIQTESFPLESFRSWMDVMDYPWLVGDFVWTAIDYIGEASIGWRGYMQNQNFFPWNLGYCGDIDICGWKRPQSYYRDVLWKENQLSIFIKPPVSSFEENPKREAWSKWHWYDAVADWNWKGFENQPLKVSIYSSCDEAELFLNDKSLGKKKTNRDSQFMAVWEVPYQNGELKAVGYKGKKKASTAILRTAGDVATIKLSADRAEIKADNQDLSYITVELNDASGTRNPKAEFLLKFEVNGPGKIVGVGNANPESIESNQLSQRKTWQGRCLVIIKSANQPGSINLKVMSEGLPSAQISVKLVPLSP
jgi:beta-galactosidase